ncbi:FAD-dependent oxidoreductase [Bradyrhizobium commune]|uniref:FAD-dependent monooxygenase n=1 Tax=Bradyrhizobium commune TaxID=83627 RepID=A0A7S9H1P3_9BRAD|nr:FAD-dependent oxidoreductase [Bradyrhizobium commune]QPF92965.1 FAD-dependent monooxygenase [Bradyrhizobium commune]
MRAALRDGASTFEADVLVVGAGPVGQTLAIDLARRGVSVVLIERNETCRQHPKMERCNARTMEFYRRLGLADRIRSASRFRDIPMDVFIATHLGGKKLLQLSYPSVVAMQEAGRRCNDGTLPLEPYQLISQYTLEPLLKSVVERLPKADVRFGCEMISYSQDETGVDAEVKSADGKTTTIRTRYLVGCDGGSSTVRKQLGIKLEGRGRISQQRQIFFRSETLFAHLPFGPGRHYHFPSGMLVVQDDLKHFMANTGSVDDPAPDALLRDVFRITVPFDILNVALWHQNLLVAERYADRRVFLAGDAVHLVIPTGGLGMNTGVGDAIDLSWKLAGTLAGWGGPNLLRSYELERRPVGLHNRDVSGRAAAGVGAWRAACRPEIDSDTPEGEANRAEVARLAGIGQRLSHDMIGTELGYSYAGSPLICSDDEPPPTLIDDRYQPTTRPGSRLPHIWLDDGQALHDRIGNDFTLVSLGRDHKNLPALRQSFAEIGARLDISQIDSDPAREVYGHDLVLVRPDLHVVWRGKSVPADHRRVAAIATGHA